jgi:hypothetical protein
MGIVYLAEQGRLGRRVALKVIAPLIADDELFRTRFEREAHHAASLDHPNVVPIFDAGEIDGHLYIAMRFVDGQDLGALLSQRGRLEGSEAARIAQQVGAALDDAHANGLIHRDVKPSNILLSGGDPAGHIYLGDFGLTKDAASRSHLTNTGSWIGTIDYVAPEQVEDGLVDARSDVYALGCVLYEMLAGDLPFKGGDAQKLWAKMNRPLPSLESVDHLLARAFDPVIARGTAKDPADRYPSAGDLARAAAAAATGRANTVPEGSVATGAAATGLRQNVDASDPIHEAATRAAPRHPPAPGSVATAPVRRRGDRGVRRLLIGLGIVAALAIGAAAGALAITGLTDDESTGTTSADEESAGGETTVTETTEGDGSETVTSAAPARYSRYFPAQRRFGYLADLPTGNGWLKPAETRPYDSALLRTTVRGPDGMFVLIDRTPDNRPEFSGDFDSSREISNPTFGQSVTEYVFSESESFPECDGSTCVDYLIEDRQGGGWGVLAGGPNLPLAKEIATTVAESITYGE